MKNLFNNFFRGLLLVFPVGATIYIIYGLVRWANASLNTLIFEPFNVDIPGLGIFTVFFGVSLLGYVCTRAFVRPLVNYFERFLASLPLVKIIYTSIKELTEAFVGEKKKFNRPVLIELNDTGLKRLGFITSEDLTEFGLSDAVAVYCPHSYNFSGNFFFVEQSKVTPVKKNSTEIMKYIISAGVTDINR
ncbi:DUF502 domain-containing protein [Halalkalibaculum sp. DA3122]|uniref:DUF502 domain-containing protein n=1 Tax=unclassified Halalkalibaculum TaxID=2964617 RepID=UPI003754514A